MFLQHLLPVRRAGTDDGIKLRVTPIPVTVTYDCMIGSNAQRSEWEPLYIKDVLTPFEVAGQMGQAQHFALCTFQNLYYTFQPWLSSQTLLAH